MPPKTVSEIRKAFLDFFASKGHTIVPSSSLIPVGDPTLLFTTAGMVQFKPLFTGAVPLPYTRAASSQKSLRTTDLERVGRTERHCTFFEMLGNFSFGDYFKKEAIEYALDFSVNYLGFPKDKIWITVYLDDDEAEQMWMNVGIPKERIVRLGKEDNFWGPAGETGACGPCSELYLDRGIEKAKPSCGANCKPGCDCDRFLEYWNLVFNQFDKDKSGVYNPLKQTGIDTGSGLERVALLLQNVDSVYDTDELKKIIQYIEKLSGVTYNSSNAPSFRVLTDHSRAIVFAISDGIYPDKTGRGYVIRRLIRRASLYARKIQILEPFLYKLVKEVISIYKGAYPYLESKQAELERILLSEETLFLNTLESGLQQLESYLVDYKASSIKVFKGEHSFKLYGTYGFPKEMTREIVEEKGLQFDEVGFEKELEKDRAISRESWKGKHVSFLAGVDKSKIIPTQFTGYKETNCSSQITLLFNEEKEVDSLPTGSFGVIVSSTTCFYAESGGQIGDVGFIRKGDAIFQVKDTQKENDVFLHIGSVISGSFSKGDSIDLSIDAERRKLLTYHHSGTHLLNGALRSILGNHVMQKASLVSDDYLRFDFSHPSPLSEPQLELIEAQVNKAIQSKVVVETKELPIEEAKKTGAVAAFDEKYGDKVRVVTMKEFSVEFCGGCHVSNTGDIGYFLIRKEASPGAGNRRIEAVCGPAVIEYFQEEFQNLSSTIQAFNLSVKKEIGDNLDILIHSPIPDPEEIQKQFVEKGAEAVTYLKNIKSKLLSLLEERNHSLMKEKKKKEEESVKDLLSFSNEILEKAKACKGIVFAYWTFDNYKVDLLKQLGDKIKNTPKPVLVLFANKTSESVVLLYMCNKAAIDKGISCNDILKKTSPILGGKGGGKPDMAQGGGKDVSKLEEVFIETEKLILEMVK